MNDRYIKLDAIERLAKPMKAIHEKEGYDEEGDEKGMGEHHKCACPCCGAPCEACNEADEEDSEEYEDEGEEENSEEDSDDEYKS